VGSEEEEEEYEVLEDNEYNDRATDKGRGELGHTTARPFVPSTLFPFLCARLGG